MKNFSQAPLAAAAILLLTFSPAAQVTLTSDDPSVLIDFESPLAGVSAGTFEGTGFSPAPLFGQLDSRAWAVAGFSDGDLVFGGSANSGDLARGAIGGGGTSVGGLYSLADFPLHGGRAMAFQPGGTDFTPGSITLRIVNQDLHEIIVGLQVSYDIYVRNDEGRSTYVRFGHSPDGADFNDVSDAAYASPEAPEPFPSFQKVGGVGASRTVSISSISVAPVVGEYFRRWDSDDLSGAGSRDEIAIDNVRVNALFLGPTAADGRIIGRVTDASGRGIPFVRIELTGTAAKQSVTAYTSHFGYFSFEELETGSGYVLRAYSTRYVFDHPLLYVSLDDELEEVRFVGRHRLGAAGTRFSTDPDKGRFRLDPVTLEQFSW